MDRQDQSTKASAADIAVVKAFAASQMFERTYREGMALVEEAAVYLDGMGREDSCDLPHEASLAYAGESMRLTTRLMQIAAWLLVKKAVQEGELTPEEAVAAKYQLGAQEICQAPRLMGVDMLPQDLLDLIERSERLYEQVERLDGLLREDRDKNSPLASHLERVEMFFLENDAARRPFGRRNGPPR